MKELSQSYTPERQKNCRRNSPLTENFPNFQFPIASASDQQYINKAFLPYYTERLYIQLELNHESCRGGFTNKCQESVQQ